MGQGDLPRPTMTFVGKGIYLGMREGDTVSDVADDFVVALNSVNNEIWFGDGTFYAEENYNEDNMDEKGDFKAVNVYRADNPPLLDEGSTTPYFRIHRTANGGISIDPCQKEIDGTNCMDFLRAYVANLTRDR